MGVLVNFVTGAVLGGFVGAAAALLLAPKPGPQLRSDLKHEIDSILEEGRKAARDREAEMRHQLAVMRGEVK